MIRPRPASVLEWIGTREPELVLLLERLVAAESPSLDAAALRKPFTLLAAELAQLGYVVRRVRGTNGGHLYARPLGRARGTPFQLVVGHMDTVWPVGTLAQMPLRRDGDTLFGPGTYDMKAGLVQLVFALKALEAFRATPSVTPLAVVNADEEIGSPSSAPLIQRLARGAVRALVLEGGDGPDGLLKIARKGVGRYELIVHGRAAHAGTSFEQGASAVLELSHQVQRLFALNDPTGGVTVNVGTVDGGLRSNVVAPHATADIGVRVPTEAAARDLDDALHGLRPVLAGCALEVHGGLGRPPMEPTSRNRRLLRTAQRLGRELGLSLAGAGLVGGGSDANTTSAYTATLDGLGPCGGGDHAVDEHVSVSSLIERTALLAMLLLEPAPRRQPVGCRSGKPASARAMSSVETTPTGSPE